MGSLQDLVTNKYGFDLTEQQEDMVIRDLELIIEANATINLTRIVSWDSAMCRHIEDSLAGVPYVLATPDGLYGDLGTGGGFPGIPMAIVTGRKTLLVDSVQKKMRVLDGVIHELGLSNQVSTYAGRIEDLAKQRRGEFAVLTARALSSLPSLLELASPLLKLHGRLVCYKANPSDAEMESMRKIVRKLGFSLPEMHQFDLEDGSHRTIMVFQKVSKASISLPRRIGLAQNEPLA